MLQRNGLFTVIVHYRIPLYSETIVLIASAACTDSTTAVLKDRTVWVQIY